MGILSLFLLKVLFWLLDLMELDLIKVISSSILLLLVIIQLVFVLLLEVIILLMASVNKLRLLLQVLLQDSLVLFLFSQLVMMSFRMTRLNLPFLIIFWSFLENDSELGGAG